MRGEADEAGVSVWRVGPALGQRLMRFDANRGQFNAHICGSLSIRPSVSTHTVHTCEHRNTHEWRLECKSNTSVK